MNSPQRLKPKDIEVGMEMDRFDGRGVVWDKIEKKSDAHRRYGDEGDWVYTFSVRTPDGRTMTRIVSSRDLATVRGGS